MKKRIFAVLIAILCMALPASAATFTVSEGTTAAQLREAVASDDIEKIVIAASI